MQDILKPERSIMTSMDTSLPLAVAIRLSIQEAVEGRTNLDYRSILGRIQADGKVSAAELKAVQQALAAEIAAGSIDEARGKAIMSAIAGRLSESGSADDRTTILDTVTTFDSLSLTKEQLSTAIEAAKNAVDRGLLAKEVRSAAADGEITAAELATLWQKALGRDGTVSVQDIRAMYGTLDNLLKAGKIDAKQHAALSASMDAALAARAGRADVADNAEDYIRANNTAQALGGSPTSSETWLKALDMLEFATKDLGPGRKLSAGTVVAFADMVRDLAKPVSDTVARAVASALDTAVAAGKITAGDARAIAAVLDKRIGFERFGIGAKADFKLVALASTVLTPPTASVTTPVSSDDDPPRPPL
ncbi:MAG: hypothetical protein ACAI38_24415, partial [Myxococcota bacterium]